MANYQSSIAIDTVIEALAAFLTPFIEGGQVVRAQVNRTPMPSNPCVVLTELLEVDLEVPYFSIDSVTQIQTVSAPKRIDVQIDFYGQKAGDYCNAVKSVFRSGIGFNLFPANIRPLYTSDGLQSPLITGEQQWESRWTLTASMQYNPTVTIPGQSATALAANQVTAADVIFN